MTFLGILAIAGVVAAIFHATSALRRDSHVKTALRQVPRSRIADVGERGRAKIVGTATAAGAALTAPISGRSCVYFEAAVEEHVGDARWRTVVHEQRGVDFFVRDGSGKALIKPDGAQVAVTKDEHQRSGTWNDAAPQLEAFLAQHGRESTGLLGFNKALRYREGIVGDGETVAVSGRALWEPDPEPDAGTVTGYRDAPKRLVMSSGGNDSLFVSDDPATLD